MSDHAVVICEIEQIVISISLIIIVLCTGDEQLGKTANSSQNAEVYCMQWITS